jgi:cob(I)alamin adenosyltransferase
MLIIFTGDGKGKTSAALGIALRSLGWNKRIAIIQFIKGNKEIGEWYFLKSYELQAKKLIEIFQFFDDKKYSITEKSILENPEYKTSCEKAWDFAKKTILSKDYDLIILDEVCNAVYYKLIKEKDVLEFIRKNSSRICSDSDLILTGRKASKKLIDIADMVTEMKEIKHPFKKGISAKEGIDY